jgi:hypothetical protein
MKAVDVRDQAVIFAVLDLPVVVAAPRRAAALARAARMQEGTRTFMPPS